MKVTSQEARCALVFGASVHPIGVRVASTVRRSLRFQVILSYKRCAPCAA